MQIHQRMNNVKKKGERPMKTRQRMKNLALFLCASVLLLVMALPAMAVDYDLLIINGRVLDPESNYDAVANVGVKDGKIYKNTISN